MRSKKLKKISELYYKYGALFLLLLFASVQFVLILRHKSPYFSNVFGTSEYISFLAPVFLSYLAIIFLVFRLTENSLGQFWSVLTTALFISFYPFLDWSTYFLTDTIGAFFWLLLIILALNYILSKKRKWIYLFSFVQIVSLLNREQTLLMPALFLIFLIIGKLTNLPSSIRSYEVKLLALSSAIAAVYILTSLIFKQKNIIDTIIYTQNNYGLFNNNYSFGQTVFYLLRAVIESHAAFLKDLVQHHWWATLFLLSNLAIIQYFINGKKGNPIDVMIISSGAASYLSIFLYPVL